jgi:hypothetical protein
MPKYIKKRSIQLISQSNKHITSDGSWFRSTKHNSRCSTTGKEDIIMCTIRPSNISNKKQNSLPRIDTVWWIVTISLPYRYWWICCVEDLYVCSISIRTIDTTCSYTVDHYSHSRTKQSKAKLPRIVNMEWFANTVPNGDADPVNKISSMSSNRRRKQDV